MDRLARNLDDLKRIIKTITDKQAQVHFIKEGLEFTSSTSPMSSLMLSLMGAFAEFEHGLIRERQLEGIAKAKGRGVYDHLRKLTDEQIQEIKDIISRETELNKINRSVLAKKYNITRQCLYNYLKQKTATNAVKTYQSVQ